MEELEEDAGAEARYQALSSADRPQLVQALYDPSWRVRRAAADALARGPADETVVHQLIAVLGDRGQTGARNAAAASLAAMGSVATDPLLMLLRHPDPDQRKLAADILGERRDQGALEALEWALNDKDFNVQGAAAEALGRIGGPRAARALSVLLDSPEVLVQACALDALLALKRPPPLPRLLPLLAEPSTARGAFRLLGLVDHPAAHAKVSAAVRSVTTRDAALLALGAEPRPLSTEAEASLKAALEASPRAVDWLDRGLAHSDRTVRLGAMQAAGVLRAAALAPAVARAAEDAELAEQASRTLTRLGLYGAIALLEGDSAELLAMGTEARAVASEAITRVGEPVLVPQLTRLLGSGDPELAEVAARALGRCRSTQAISPLIEALQDDLLASAAGRALARIGASFPTEVVAALEAVPMRPHVLRALVKVDPKRAAAAVKAAAHDSDDAMRAVAAEAAAELSRVPAKLAASDSLTPPGFVPAVTRAEPGQGASEVPLTVTDAAELLGRSLSDESSAVRRAATQALARIDRPAALPLLTRALRDRDSSVQAAACEASAVLGEPAVVPRLIELTQVPHGFVVIAALQALAAHGALDDATGAGALEHADPDVVKAALALLADRALSVPHALNHLRHARWDVRAAAARALEVSADAAALAALRSAIAVEPDGMAKEIFERVAARLAER
jgi:HEAT repeat protein